MIITIIIIIIMGLSCFNFIGLQGNEINSIVNMRDVQKVIEKLNNGNEIDLANT